MTPTVRKPRHRRDGSTMSRGFTLLEVQVAVVLLVLTLFVLGGHNRVINQLLSGVLEDKRVDGYVDLATERAFLTISESGQGAGTPPCDVRVDSVDTSGTYPRVYVTVEAAGF
jgi:hypothetical protein